MGARKANDMPTIKDELEKIRKRHNGLLRARDVVEYASDPKTALHAQFEWDDTEAARKYRLHQARCIINVTVTRLPNEVKPVRAYVSVSTDRERPGGGYRSLESVLSDDEKCAVMMGDAMRELRHFREKYQRLRELAPVFKAVEQLERARGGQEGGSKNSKAA